MEHETTLIVTIVMSLVLAFSFGFVATWLKLPPLVGYLVAGIAVGPYTPGFVVDAGLASQLSEIGVILLMFGVGLHFSATDLLTVKWVAIPGAIVQITVVTTIGVLVATSWGWSFGTALVLGLCMSVASTVVLLKALDERNLVNSANGRIAIGWLIVEDLVMVLVLVLLPALAGMLGGKTAQANGMLDGNLALSILFTLGKVGAFGAIVFLFGPRLVPWLLGRAARTGSHELFTLSVLAVALGIAFAASKVFDVSFALGAFCAGVVLSKSDFSHRAAEESLPLQNAFAVLFFVSVGMLFDPSILIREPLHVLAVLGVILIGKSVTAFSLALILGMPAGSALTIAAGLAQIGEFSFILAGLGMTLGLLPSEGKDLILAGALLSITLNALAFTAVKPLTLWFSTKFPLTARGEPARRERLASLQKKLSAASKQAQPVNLSLQPGEMMNKFPVFASLNPIQRAELLALFKPRSAAPGERVIRAGDVANEMFFISSGAVEVSVGSQTIHLGPGDFFGEMALLSGGRRSADVTAIDYCLFLTLDVKDFRDFIGRHPELKTTLDEVARQRAEMNKRETEQNA